MLPLLVLLGTIAGAWYLLIVRPQKEQQTRHGRLVERLQVGDHVLTVGGIYGRVVAVEQATVVLELAPGLTSRIATDGIARIVHGAEAAIPAHTTDAGTAAPVPPRQALEDDMQQHPDQHQQQPQSATGAPSPFAPASLPQQPFAQQAPAPQPMHAQYHAAEHVAAPAPLPAPAAPQAQPQDATTLRAQVLPAIPSFEPRPWGDVAPRGSAPTMPAPQPMPMQPAYAQPSQHQQSSHYAPQAPAPTSAMPLHVPFAPQPAAPQAYAQPVHAPQPVYHHQLPTAPAPTQYAQPMPQPQLQPVQYAQPQPVQYAQPMPHAPHAQPLQYAQPVQAAQPMHAVQPAQHAPVVEAPVQEEVDQRRHSRAPKGMGSSLRLDDPSLRDTMTRAREERAELADEYRKLTAPLVEVAEQQPQPQGPQVYHDGQPQFVGHDANGVPLFASPGAPGVQPIEQYPAPMRVPAEAGAVPRPNVTAQTGEPDAAFQRRTPYSPQQAQAAAPALEPAHA